MWAIVAFRKQSTKHLFNQQSGPVNRRDCSKQELVTGIKKHFHCSAKEAHYIIGVARRKKLVDIAAEFVTLL